MVKFFKKTKEEPENLEELLSAFKELKKSFEEVSQELKELKKENKFVIQKIGLIRYNPFSEVGGDQSFSMALLDGNNDGIVVTSLYTREGNRVYGKPVEKGKAQYALSDEETRVLELAKNYEGRKTKEDNPPANSGGSGTY